MLHDGPGGKPSVRSVIESDEAVSVDDDPARTMWGTGTEDYLNDAWGLHTISLPLPKHGLILHGRDRSVGGGGKRSAS